jgi:hypothetical protein
MKIRAELVLRDRCFAVREARISKTSDGWSLEINTQREEYDGEWWEPHLYHQGLRLSARTAKELQGATVSWDKPGSPSYEHPEIGALYVFGHHVVEDAVIHFGEFAEGVIELEWTGIADVFWDEPFAERVPFRCSCLAKTHEG